MNKKKAVGIIVVFFTLIVMPNIAYFFLGKYVDNKNYENRAKASSPVLTIDTYRDFPKKYETFFNDHIPFRNQLIRMNSSIDYFVFKQPADKRVVVGDDGWLFYRRDSDGNPVRHSLGYWHFKNEELKTIAENLVRTRDELKRRNIDFFLFIAPNKESVYREYIPDYYPVKDKTMSTDQLVEYLKKNTDVKVVYAKKEILAAKGKHKNILLYKKLDTHWNDLGAYFGVAELAKKLRVAVPEFEKIKYNRRVVSSGDLTNMLNVNVENGDTIFDVVKISNNKTERKVLDKKNEVWDYVTTKAEGEAAPDKRRVFLCGDSFRSSMAPNLSPLFSNLRVVHKRSFSPQQIYDYRANVFVYEIVERSIRGIRGLSSFKSIYQYHPSDKKLAGITSIRDYLADIKANKGRYTIFIAARDEAAQSLSNEAKELLKSLGLKADWKDAYRKSYYAVIDRGNVLKEEMAKAKLAFSGSFDGSAYKFSVESMGYDVGNKCSIKINDVEYAKNGRGLNIVVFNHENKTMDSVCFDTHDKANKASR